ncbi:lipoprotein-releasing system ATP-binding protein LolD [candidate division KSB1 bacterium]|nr:MAG: lipoprotein-releasing system ATP-binding protein LolD [candidate division KSB1 bacterium]
MAEQQPLLQAVNIHKSYFLGRNELRVLKGIDLEIYQGEILAIVGPSGVGKSTLLHILGALDRPTEGEVYIDSTMIFSMNDDQLAAFRNRTVGFVFQFHHLLPEFTALENVAMPGLIAGKPKNMCFQKASRLLESVGLKERSEHRPSELSGGEQQRVAVARALMNDPKIILADEPSGNLDLKSSRALHDLLWRLSREQNQTIVIVTHNQQLAQKGDRIVELYDGKIVN